ncbi:MAG: response regulator [Clostridium sp.]|nr:response regulator [Clostridium sp.]
MKIVIVEDEYVICNGLVNLIENYNDKYEIVGQAFDGNEGLKILREKKADLVITDIRMPDMDGIEMLSILRKENINVKAIIISAYSEFEYAKKAINLGVSEYILKPVSVNEMFDSLKKIEDDIQNESMINNLDGKQLFKLDNIFLNSIAGTLKDFEQLSLFVKNQYDIDVEDKFYIFTIYTGSCCEKNIKDLNELFASINNDSFKFESINVTQDKIHALIFYNVNDYDKLKKYISMVLIKMISTNISSEFSYGIITSCGIKKIHDDYIKIRKALEWCLTYENTLIEYEGINNMSHEKLVMNIDIEDNIRKCVINNDYEALKKSLCQFENYCKEGIHIPSDIKALCIKLFWTIVNTERQINAGLYEKIDVKLFLQSILDSITWGEIENLFESLIKVLLCDSACEQSNDRSLLIKRALNLIEEYYSQGINLEEVSNKLNVTPEYLGKQFKKEVGKTFNIYIRNYRNDKIKTLLLGTNLKIYEISRLVGYSDSKYMSKVFKESTGYLPNDYRKINK